MENFIPVSKEDDEQQLMREGWTLELLFRETPEEGEEIP